MPRLLRKLRILAALALILPVAVNAATITVNSLDDELTNNLDCSLREAIEAAETDLAVDGCTDGDGPDTINFDPALTAAGDVTINLTVFDTGIDSDEFGPTAFDITTDVTLDGPTGNHGVTLERSGASAFRLFRVTSSGNLTIRRLTLTNGLARGGAGSRGGGGAAGMGGAIFNEGTVLVESSTLVGNQALGGASENGQTSFGGGGGVGADSTQAGGGPNGGNKGGIGIDGKPGGNGGGGGAGGAGSILIDGGDGGAGGFGGGGGRGGSDGAPGAAGSGGDGGFGGGGGGRFQSNGGLGSGGHGGGNGGGKYGGGGAGMGGAIFNNGGTVRALNVTFSANGATGGAASSSAGGGDGQGGAILNRSGFVSMTFCTFADNAAVGGVSAAGLGGSGTGGAYYAVTDGADSNQDLIGSLFADSVANFDCFITGPSVLGGGGNLIESGQGCDLSDELTTDPGLGPLTDNGGPVSTHALTDTSAAHNQIADGEFSCGMVSDDARGAARPTAGFCDIGAFEFTPTLTIGDVAAVVEGAVATVDFIITRDDDSTDVSVTAQGVSGTATTGQDFIAEVQVLNLASGGPLTKTYTVQIINDTTVEFNETFTVELSAASGGFITDGIGQGTIEADADSATVSLHAVAGNEADGPFQAQVTLDNPVEGEISVDVSTLDVGAEDENGDGDYQSLDGHTVTFPSLSTLQIVDITIHDDAKLENTEAFVTVLSNLQNGGFDVSFDPSFRANNITNDDSVTLSISDVSLVEGSGGGTTVFDFIVEMTGDAVIPVSFDVQTNDAGAEDENGDGDYQSLDTQATFAAGAMSTTVTILVNTDEAEEMNERFFVDLSNGLPSGFVSFNSAQGQGTIEDDDDQGPATVSATAAEGDPLNECADMRVAMAELAVTFDQAMWNPDGDVAPSDVTNPSNYLLVGTGPDLDFSTTGCAGGAAGDDVTVLIHSVTWNGVDQASLSFDPGGTALDDGLYQLHACASLSDLAGNGLDGDASGGPSEDFVRRFRADQSNGFENGHFDHCGTTTATLDPWTVDVEAPSDVDPEGADASASLLSSSARITGLVVGGDGTQVTLSQCATVASGATYELGASLRQGPDTAQIDVHAFCFFFSGAACDSGVLSSEITSASLTGTDDKFIEHGHTMVAPAGALSALCGYDFEALTDPFFEAEIDQLWLKGVNTPIFSDGFESGDLAGWSLSQGG